MTRTLSDGKLIFLQTNFALNYVLYEPRLNKQQMKQTQLLVYRQSPSDVEQTDIKQF